MTDPKLEDMIKAYFALEKLIRLELAKLPHSDSECRCDSDEALYLTDIGPSFPETHGYCTECGGIKNP